MKRVGILGGSFNPVHFAHLAGATGSKQLLSLDEIWMWPAHNVHKDPTIYAPPEDIAAMLNLMTVGQSWLKVQTMEKDFYDSYTATSLCLLKHLYPQTQFTWIFGDDNFTSFHTWNRVKFPVDGKRAPDWQYILRNFPIAVISRNASPADVIASPAGQYDRTLYVENAADMVNRTSGWTLLDCIPAKDKALSSTHIRQDLKDHKKNIAGLLPAVEDYIYAHGLFGTQPSMPQLTIAAPANSVRFHAFVLLADMANLVKSIAVAQGVDGKGFESYARSCWDRAQNKGDFGKTADVPAEIADCLISLDWLANHQNVVLPHLPKDGTEDQSSVMGWCSQHFPDETLEEALRNAIEEMTELCVCEGMEKERMLNLLKLVWSEPDCTPVSSACMNSFATLCAYADELGPGLNKLIDDKMIINRLRTPEQSAQRLAKKRQIIKQLAP